MIERNVSELKIGESAIIDSFSEPSLSIKLLEMGCIPGCEIQMKYIAPFGDPICVCVCGYNLSLRLQEASTIGLK